MSNEQNHNHKLVISVARALDLHWRETCGYEPDMSHEISFTGGWRD